MSADALLATWTRAARVRGAADDVALGLPGVLAVAAVVWRAAGVAPAIVAAAVGIAVVALVAARRSGRFDTAWLARRLDARRGDMEDSAGLLFADAATLGPLQRLQRDRLARRLDDDGDLRPAWSARAIGVVWLVAAAVVAAALLWPARGDGPAALAPSAEGVPAVPGVPRLVGQSLRIVPPAYTGLPARDEASLDVKAPGGSRLVWTLRFAPQPAGAAIALHNGRPLALERRGEVWTTSMRLDRSTLYRVTARGAEALPAPPLHRLDAIPDTPPRIKVILPDRGLSLVTLGQRRWPLAFEVSDDHGVAPTARLRVIVAEGEGEQVTFRERVMTVAGSGDRRRRRFAPSIDLAAFGFKSGSDLVAQLIVSDNRTPGPQVVRGPSLILRWPSDLGQETSALEGMVKKVMPAYFRSQRQIIIDAEKLLKQRRALSTDEFFARSNALGVDQRLLRLRYGQFLGETSEGEPESPTNDAAGGEAHSPGDGHDHDASGAGTPGSAADIIASVGHTHDEPEAATLLDPQTRTLLRQALDNMWGSEGALRTGDPKAALPFAYKALAFIKQVQQASRIYLQRVGPDQPPIDETRRMTGKREGLASRALPLLPQDGGDAVPAATWRALGEGGGALGLDALEGWLRGNEARLADPLAFTAAIDAVRRDPDCGACRRALRGLLWSALARPPAQVLRRDRGDAEGRRYLDALAR